MGNFSVDFQGIIDLQGGIVSWFLGGNCELVFWGKLCVGIEGKM